MKAVVTVVGKDRIGIISEVSTLLANNEVNILDVDQTIFDENFTMMMHVHLGKNTQFHEIKKILEDQQNDLNLAINIYNEKIFKKMHSI